MSKVGSAKKVKLNSFDDLFGANAPAASDQIVNVALSELHTFQNHPFKVSDDKEMEELAESIRQHGVLMPGIARPRAEGGYELIPSAEISAARTDTGMLLSNTLTLLP